MRKIKCVIGCTPPKKHREISALFKPSLNIAKTSFKKKLFFCLITFEKISNFKFLNSSTKFYRSKLKITSYFKYQNLFYFQNCTALKVWNLKNQEKMSGIPRTDNIFRMKIMLPRNFYFAPLHLFPAVSADCGRIRREVSRVQKKFKPQKLILLKTVLNQKTFGEWHY